MEFQVLEYEETLRSLNMYSLEMKRTRGDLIQLFKFVKQEDMESLNWDLGVPMGV